MQDSSTMREDFTAYLRSLDPRGKPPGETSFATVFESLRGALIGELKRRALWRLSPRYLGIIGQKTWTQEALDELVADCYVFTFLERLDSLRAQLQRKTNVEGLIFLNIRNFVYERQRQHDPLGFRVFASLQKAAREAIQESEMIVIAGDQRVQNNTVLALRSDIDLAKLERVDLYELATHVATWNDDLLPELITTRGKGHRRVLAKLRRHLRGLEREGFDIFTFGNVVQPLKAEARRRWVSVFEHAGPETGFADPGCSADAQKKGAWLNIVALVHPEAGFEERESFRALVDCVDEQLEEQKQRHLETLWRFLTTISADPGDLSARAVFGEPTVDMLEEIPSRRKIARLLHIPKNRMPALYDTLGRLVRECQEATGGGTVGPFRQPSTVGRAPRGASMSRGTLQEELRQRTAEAMTRSAERQAKLAARDARRPQPGDIFLLSENAGSPVEWVVLDEDSTFAGRFIAVPADTHPMAGSGDLALGSDVVAGPLTIRLRFATSLRADVFAAAVHRDLLDTENLQLAQRKLQDLADGRTDASPRQREVDAEPAYEDWIREIVAPAVAAVTSAEPAGREKGTTVAQKRRWDTAQRRVSVEWIYGLAATLALMAVGAGGWIVMQRQEIAQLERPSFEVRSAEIRLNSGERGSEPIRLRESSHLVLTLLIGSEDPCETYRLEVLDSEKRVLAVLSDLTGPLSETELVLSPTSLRKETLTIRLVGLCNGELRPLEEHPVKIVIE